MMELLCHWFVQCVVLFLIPFLNENLAIVTAAIFVHVKGLPIGLAFGCLYAGVVAGDLLIYSLGRWARRIPRLRLLLNGSRMQRAQQKLKRNRILAIAGSRVLPGLLFATFSACGWSGMPFMQFFIPAMVTSVLYTGIMLLLVLKFGEIVVTVVGRGGWIALFVLFIVIAGAGTLRKVLCRLRGRKVQEEPADIPIPMEES